MAFAGAHIENILRGCFRAQVRRVDSVLTSVHNVLVDSVFGVFRTTLKAVEPTEVGFVFSEQ